MSPEQQGSRLIGRALCSGCRPDVGFGASPWGMGAGVIPPRAPSLRVTWQRQVKPMTCTHLATPPLTAAKTGLLPAISDHCRVEVNMTPGSRGVKAPCRVSSPFSSSCGLLSKGRTLNGSLTNPGFKIK